MTIKLYSDIACPWCYIGERRLMEAARRIGEEVPDFSVEVKWQPFQLQPDMPKNGAPWEAFVNWKFGGIARAQPMFDRVADAGRSDGIDFRFDRMTVAPNTRDAHRVVLLGERHGLGLGVAERLFSGLFTEGRNLNDHAELAVMGSEAGLSERDVLSMLHSPAYADEIRTAQEAAARLGIQGVPFFIFDDRYAVSGAHPVADFEEVLREAEKNR